jgi:hypothetical protein
MHVHVSLTISSISTTPPPTTHPHRTTPLLGAGHARNDLQRHRQFEALIDARFGPAQERARRPRRPQGPGVANAPHTQTSPKPHTHTALSTTTTTQTPQSKIAPPGIVGKGAEKLISAEDAAQVVEAVGRERTSAC